MARSVYIHIPFCKSICSYCDFCKVFYVKKWADRYLEELYNEITDRYEGELIKTLYIGGGSPSQLNEHDLEKLEKIINLFQFTEDYEFTFEANINDLNDIYLTRLKNMKVNRLSIGIESFDEKKLKLMGRDADFDQASKIIKIARSKGFDNINIDMIYGLPNESLNTLKEDVKKVLKLKPDHISFYSLIFEPNTKLFLHYKKGVSQDEEYEMYSYIKRTLSKAGYEHYEISNYAKNGKYAKHNLVYWNNDEYYGFGLGAAGYLHEVRYENTRSISKYLDGNYMYKRELVSIEDEKKNKLMLGLRLTKGVNLNEWFLKYGDNLEADENIQKLIKEKLLKVENNYLFINPKKLYVMNEILIRII
ncbi:MAG: radical SAM family heme chaperone HemW [Bacilli bacterium]|nr:radical SAM family heme chaperone HemW [Bacilli bacterium]